jgi:predicted HTH domain antitoxin
MSKHVTVEVPDDATNMFGGDAARFGREMYEAAVLLWFEESKLSQGQAAELLGMNRGEFFDLLHTHQISPIQMSIGDLEQDFQRG